MNFSFVAESEIHFFARKNQPEKMLAHYSQMDETEKKNLANVEDADGRTPLHCAVFNDDQKLIVVVNKKYPIEADDFTDNLFFFKIERFRPIG